MGAKFSPRDTDVNTIPEDEEVVTGIGGLQNMQNAISSKRDHVGRNAIRSGNSNRSEEYF
jgi:hypothetical protein